jgi:hypothetical protein
MFRYFTFILIANKVKVPVTTRLLSKTSERDSVRLKMKKDPSGEIHGGLFLCLVLDVYTNKFQNVNIFHNHSNVNWNS